jgi:HlyD family secretion protein
VDGIPEPIPARVESIATQGEFTPANLQTPEERGKQVFGVRIRLRQPDDRVKPGMYVTVKRLGAWEP